MIGTVISAVLGFLTLPFVGMVIWGMVEIGKLIGGFDLPLGPYWAGFFLLIGCCIVTGSVVGVLAHL